MKTDIKTIARSPEAFYGKEVVLEGYAWGWMAQNLPDTIQKLKKLPMAKGSWGGKNYGTFSDGTMNILFPIAPGEYGHFRVRAVVKHNEFGWYLEPIEITPLD